MYPGTQDWENLMKILYTIAWCRKPNCFILEKETRFSTRQSQTKDAWGWEKGMTPDDLHGLKIKDQMAPGMFQQMSAWTDDTEDQMPPNPRL